MWSSVVLYGVGVVWIEWYSGILLCGTWHEYGLHGMAWHGKI
jgi:hypothetical protein